MKSCTLFHWWAGFALLFLLAACTSAPATPTQDPGQLGAILRRGTLVIATDPAYPPQSELVAGEPRAANTKCAVTEYTANQLEGFDVDVATEIASRLGVEACFVTPTWSQIISGNWNDRWDMNVGSMVITDERMQALYFSQPYTTGSAVIFVHQDNQNYQEPADLSGKRIGLCAGCAYEAYLNGSLVIPGQEIDFVIQDATAIGYDTDTSALGDLALGDGVRLDGVLTDPDTGRTAIEQGLPIRQLAKPAYYDYVAAAIDKHNSKDPLTFVQKVIEIIQQMHADGALKRLSEQYYQGDFTQAAASYDIYALGQAPEPGP
jgi:polar amino acid transport system substrate-binding protein